MMYKKTGSQDSKNFTALVFQSVATLIVTVLIMSAHHALAQPIKLGWQLPWATQGQLVMGLKHTNIPEIVGIEIEYPGFAYGGPLNLAALSGDIDVLLTADQPALVLLSKSERWFIVARMMYNRVCVYVPPKSSIKDLNGLSGKQVLGPVGAAAERVALAGMKDMGVDLATVQLGKLDMMQQKSLIERSGSNTDQWASAQALYGFDPLPASFEKEGKAKMIHSGNVVSVVVASEEMLNKRRPELEAFLQAFTLSWFFYSQNGSLANSWFDQNSRLGLGDGVLDLCASVEPNRWVDNIDSLRLDFVKEDYDTLDEALTFLLDRGVIREKFAPRSRIKLSPLQAALNTDLVKLYAKVHTKK